jgi:2-dehydropantoate 2-reductase
MEKPLSILVLGAGAIGTYIGGSLALAGHDVVFLERPQVAAQLRERGLRLHLSGNERHIPAPRVTASLGEAFENKAYDLGVFALKSYDTQGALQDLQPYNEILPPILCLQNGIDNEAALEKALGSPEKVIAGTVTSAIGRRAAGDIVLERLRGIGIAATHTLAPRLERAMQAARLNPQLYQRPLDMKWSKLLVNLVANATSAILDMKPEQIFAHPALFKLEISQLRETLAVMHVQGIHAVDLPATPVRLLAFSVRYIPAKLSRPLLAKSLGGGRGAKMPSFHIDLHSGRRQNEVDYLNGAVVRYGTKLGIPTPVNRLLNETLLALTRGDLPIDAFARQPEALLNVLTDNR